MFGGLISAVRPGPCLLCQPTVALLETFNAFPGLHGACCNSIFSMTAGKGNQVIKCEKSGAGLRSPFCSVSLPRQLPSCGRGAAQRLRAAGRTAERCLVVRIQQASHVPLSVATSHQLEKLGRVGPLSQDTLYAPGLHCLGADVGAPGAWWEPQMDRKGQEAGGVQAGKMLPAFTHPFQGD